jgi:hypothetical protein
MRTLGTRLEHGGTLAGRGLRSRRKARVSRQRRRGRSPRRERFLPPNRDVGIWGRSRNRRRLGGGRRRERRQRLRRHAGVGKAGIAGGREGLRPFPVRSVRRWRGIGRRGHRLRNHRLQRLFGGLTDDAISQALTNGHGEQQHHGSHCQDNGGKSHRWLHGAGLLYPSERAYDVEFGGACAAVARFADQVHLAQLARRHVDARRVPAEFQ